MNEETANRNAFKIRYTRKKLLEIGEKPICKKMPDCFSASCKNLAEHSSSSVDKHKYSQPQDCVSNPPYDIVTMYQQPLNEHRLNMRTFHAGGSRSQIHQEGDFFPQRPNFVNICGTPDLVPPKSKRNKPNSFWPNRFPNQHYQNKHLESNYAESMNKSGTKNKSKNEILMNETVSVDHFGKEKSTSTEPAAKDLEYIKPVDENKENVNYDKEFENSIEFSSNENIAPKMLEKQWFSKYDHGNVKDHLEKNQTNCQLVGDTLFQVSSKDFQTEVKNASTAKIFPSFSSPSFGKNGKGDGVNQNEGGSNDMFMTTDLNVTTKKEYFITSSKMQISPTKDYLVPEYKVNNSSVVSNSNAPSDITNIMSNLKIQTKQHSGQGDSPSTCFMVENNMCYLPRPEPSEGLNQHSSPKAMPEYCDSKLSTNYSSIHIPEANAESSPESVTSAETKQKKSPREIFPDLTQLQPEQKMEANTKSTPKITNPRALLMQLPFDIQLLVKNAKPTSEMLSRTEAMATLSGLKNGQMTLDHLARQLQNSALQQRHKELLACILKMCIQDPLLMGHGRCDPSPTSGTPKKEGTAVKPAMAWVLTKVPSEQLGPAYCQLLQSPRSGVVYPASQLLMGPRPIMPLPARIMQKNHAARLLQEQLRQLGPAQPPRSFGAEELDNFNLQPAPEDSK
ncbi:uncharacterized protein LOC134533111 [Bacillus rossius redtenbacheri]|uniref:uncharacterized protein LOC134533111 n=1 Tax=Bacillus rossius redtenbacheri TaxID=93214 RepID=UPI002FDD6129